MFKTLSYLAVAALTLAPAPGYANDTIANLAAGGLVFRQTDQIRMVSEDLYLSAREVRVTYRFLNLTDRDLTETVAFPMPDIRRSFSDVAYPDGPAENPMRFSVTVDGRTVSSRLEKKATVEGADVTASLKELGIPLEIYTPETDEDLQRLDRGTIARLRQRNIVEMDESYPTVVRNGQVTTADQPVATPIPNWTFSATYHWQQTFPAGKQIVIDHRYKPSVGGHVISLDEMAKAKNEAGLQLNTEGACADRDFINGARKWAERERKLEPTQSIQLIDYVLVTGANWAGSIKNFTLTVDKGRPDNLVSFCGEGVKKTGPTQFRMEKSDFTPRQNIRILILDTGRGR